MRVVCITPVGLADYTIGLSNALSQKLDRIALITSRNVRSELANSLDKKVSLCLVEPTSSWFCPTNLRLVSQVNHYVSSFQPAVIHIQTGHIWYWMAVFARLRQYPVVTTLHDPEPHIGEKRLSTEVMNSLAVKHAKQVIVHAEALRELVINKLGVPRHRVNVIPQGERYSAFKPWRRSNVSEENLILFFGRIVDYKGLEYLIRAQPLVKREVPDARVVIAGDGDLGKYRPLITDIGGFLIYNRFITSEEGAELFQRCKVVVLPYIEASQTGVAQVAYGFGKPVIATNVGGLPEIVLHGETGLIVPPKDSRALANAVVHLLKDDTFRRRMGEQGRLKLESEYSWDSIAQKTIAVYQKSLEEK